MRKTLSLLTAAILLLSLCTGCGRKDPAEEYITSLVQLDDSRYTIGIGTGTASARDAADYFTRAHLVDFSSQQDAYLSVQMGKLDAFAFSRVNMEYAIASGGLRGVALLEENVGNGADVVVGISRKAAVPDLQQKVNGFIDVIHSDGTFDDAYNRWIIEAQEEMPELPMAEHPDCTIRIGTAGTVEPFTFYKGDQLIGLDVELLYRFAYYINADVDVQVIDFFGLLSAAESGTIDCIFANLNATPERAEIMDFSVPIYRLETGIMVRSPDPASPPLSAYDGQRLGVITGSVHEELASSVLPHAELRYFSGFGDMIAGLNSGVIDGFFYPSESTGELLAGNPGFVRLEEPIGHVDCAFAFGKDGDGPELCGQLSDYIRKLRASGGLDELRRKWMAEDTPDAIDTSGLPSDGRTLVFATSGDAFPFSYILNGEPAGYDVELVVNFCREYGYGLDIEIVNFSGEIPGLVAGMYDLAGDCIIVTEERAESVLFSEPDHNLEISMVVNRAGVSESVHAGFWQSLADSFEKTFVREQRWKLITRGIGTTIFIALFSSLFGTVLGFGLCLLRRLRRPLLFRVTSVYIRILQGTPLVVLLMVLYYLVFPHSGLAGEWVAIIAFSLNFAAYVSEIIRAGIDGVDIGQTEAALALGFTKRRAFLHFILPQAAQSFLPVYKGEFISLVKMTSIVGYIAVQDLTKMSDIIRARTYEAFFPLISTALIYFLISAGLSSLLRLVEIRITPDRRNRTVKGVKMQ